VVSAGRRGVDIRDDDGKEAGRHDQGTKGKADRPEGSSDDRDRTGIWICGWEVVDVRRSTAQVEPWSCRTWVV
jgi:hypothetical protein